MIVDIIHQNLIERPKKARRYGVHPSLVTSKYHCLRQTYFKIKDGEPLHEQPTALRDILVFEHGHALHAMIQEILAPVIGGEFHCSFCEDSLYGYANKLFRDPRDPKCDVCGTKRVFKELELFDEGYKLTGSVDCVLELEGDPCVVDIKSANPFTFSGNLPLQSHVDQVHLYMYMMDNEYDEFFGKVRRGCILYYNKETDQLRECHFEFSRDTLMRVLDDLVTPYKDLVIEGIIPEEPPSMSPYCKPKTSMHNTCTKKDVCKACALGNRP